MKLKLKLVYIHTGDFADRALYTIYMSKTILIVLFGEIWGAVNNSLKPSNKVWLCGLCKWWQSTPCLLVIWPHLPQLNQVVTCRSRGTCLILRVCSACCLAQSVILATLCLSCDKVTKLFSSFRQAETAHRICYSERLALMLSSYLLQESCPCGEDSWAEQPTDSCHVCFEECPGISFGACQNPDVSAYWSW